MRTTGAALMVAAGALLSSSAFALEISDIRSGLVCSDEDGRPAWVCHEASDIHVTGEGSCVYDRRRERCTWYGFSFEYAGNVPGTMLDCEFQQSHPATHGNPDGVVEENVRSGRYALPLEHAEGRFFNPQYSVLASQGTGMPVQTMATRCTIEGREILDFTFNLHYPRL